MFDIFSEKQADTQLSAFFFYVPDESPDNDEHPEYAAEGEFNVYRTGSNSNDVMVRPKYPAPASIAGRIKFNVSIPGHFCYFKTLNCRTTITDRTIKRNPINQ